jgi:histone-binding protein RBBP4
MPDILIFDRTKHGSNLDAGKSGKKVECKPDLRLKGHSKEGFALAWSPLSQGWLVSGAQDFLVNLYDVQSAPKDTVNVSPVTTFRGHKNVVNDVAFSCHQPDLFASCGDDNMLLLWDRRDASAQPTSLRGHHGLEVMCIAFNPFNEHLLVSGGADKAVALWDTRKPDAAVHTFESHQEQVLAVAWAPFCETVLASSSGDRRVCVWDTAKIGEEQEPEDAEDGPPELLVWQAEDLGPSLPPCVCLCVCVCVWWMFVTGLNCKSLCMRD